MGKVDNVVRGYKVFNPAQQHEWLSLQLILRGFSLAVDITMQTIALRSDMSYEA